MITAELIFAPRLVATVGKKIREQFPKSWEATTLEGFDVEALFKEIRDWDEDEMASKVQSLRPRQFTALAWSLPTCPQDIRPRVIAILESKLDVRIVHSLWSVMQANPNEQAIHSIFRNAIQRGITIAEWIGISPDWSWVFLEGIRSPDPSQRWAQAILKSEKRVHDCMQALCIAPNSALGLHLWWIILCQAPKEFFLAQDQRILAQRYAELSVGATIVAARRYLETLAVTELGKTVMLTLQNLFGDDRNPRPPFYELGEPAASRYLLYWRRERIGAVFGPEDSERSHFWREVAARLSDVRYHEPQGVLFLFFKRHVAVEFIEKGNALYIYEKDTFERFFERYATGYTYLHRKAYLKDRNLARTWLYHQPGWQGKVLQWLDDWLV